MCVRLREVEGNSPVFIVFTYSPCVFWGVHFWFHEITIDTVNSCGEGHPAVWMVVDGMTTSDQC